MSDDDFLGGVGQICGVSRGVLCSLGGTLTCGIF